MRRQLLISFAAATAATALGGIVTASADDLGSFGCTSKSGGVSGVPGTVASVRVAHHDAYDRLVIEFAPSAAGAMPAYSLTPQASSTFTRDASGQSVKLDGSAGIRAVFRNTTEGSGAPSDIKPGLPAIREVANIGDFERVTSYGIGLSGAACFRALELSGPTRLVVDVQAADTNPSDLASTGQPQAPAQPAGLPLAQIALGLLVLTGGLALTGLRLIGR